MHLEQYTFVQSFQCRKGSNTFHMPGKQAKQHRTSSVTQGVFPEINYISLQINLSVSWTYFPVWF